MDPRRRFPHLARLSQTGRGSINLARNPRGRPVVAADGREVGAVDDLIMDTDADRVRYLVCRLDSADESEPSPRVLLPIGHTRLTPDGRVRLQRCTSEEVEELPRFRGSLEEGSEGIWTTYGTEAEDGSWR